MMCLIVCRREGSLIAILESKNVKFYFIHILIICEYEWYQLAMDYGYSLQIFVGTIKRNRK